MTTSPVVPFDSAAVDQRKGNELAVVPAEPVKPGPLPVVAWDQRKDVVPRQKVWHDEGPTSARRRKIESILLVALAGVDNLLCYVTYATVRAFHGRLYNIIDLNLTLLPNIDTALLIFAALGTACFVALIVLVECMGLPVFHETMNARLICTTLPCGIICAILVYHSEQTEWAPFLTLTVILFSVFLWCLHMKVHYGYQLNTCSRISLDVSWFVALVGGIVLVLLFSTDSLRAITNSDQLMCPHAANQRMPVFSAVLHRWYCVPWDSLTHVQRVPVEASPVPIVCSDTFVGVFGISIEAHTVTCPQACLSTFSGQGGTTITGCGVYSVDSPICPAAIHAGVLTDAGGEVTLFGRTGVPVFERCSRNSVVTSERRVLQIGDSVSVSAPASGAGSSPYSLPGGGARRLVTTPVILASNGSPMPQAFHFNNFEDTREYIHLKQYEQVPSNFEAVVPGKPWTQIEATVSLRLAGIELEDEKVQLGEPQVQALFYREAVGQVFDARPVECTIQATGVLCQGNSAAVLMLDFCRPEVKSCPEE